MSCIKCKTIDTKEEPLTICDKCNNKFCQTCAKLSTTEYRAVTMKSARILVYWCLHCRANSMTTENQDLKQFITDVVRTEITLALKAIPLNSNTNLSTKLDTLSVDVNNLRESNIDLVRLLTQGNQIMPSSNLAANHHAHENQHKSQYREFQTKIDNLNQELLGLKNFIQGKEVPNLSKNLESSTNESSNLKVSHQNIPPIKEINNTGKQNISITPHYTSIVRDVPRSSHHNERKKYRNQQNIPIIGTRKNENLKITAAKIHPKATIQVRKLGLEVTAEDLNDYLKSTFGQLENFKIEKLTVKSEDYNSYRVDANAELRENLLDSTNWPEGVEVKIFQFFRPRNRHNSTYKANNHQSNRHRTNSN